MFKCSNEQIDNAQENISNIELENRKIRVVRFENSQGIPYTWLSITQALSEQSQFRNLWNGILADTPFDFQWKPIPIHPQCVKSYPFFVVLVSSSFPVVANPKAYQKYLNQLCEQELIATFTNLSGDATLIIPRATGQYGHIRSFCQQASRSLMEALWQGVGKLTLEKILRKETFWCNTHGHGVPWLHIRFDRQLKYTAFPPRGEINQDSQQQWYQNIYAKAYLS